MKHVLFVHIQKTGGVSVQAMIRRHDGPINPAYVSNFVSETDWTAASQYKYHFTHGSLCIRELLPRPLFVFTILRDPVDRAISLYNHFLRLDGESIHEIIVNERLDFIAALTHPALSSLLTTEATRVLGTEVDLRAAWPNAAAMSLAERWALDAPADEGTYQRALANLKQLDFVGFSERLDEDARDLATLLGFEIDTVPRANAAPDDYLWPLPKAVRSAEAEAAMRLHGAFDCRLYDEARKLFWVRDTARHALASRAVATIGDYAKDSSTPEGAAAEPSPITALRTRIRQLEADLAEKFEWAKSYKLLADSMLPRIRELEDERDQKFEWAQNYRQLAESLQQQVQALEADRDQKFEWAQNYRQLAESLQQQVQTLEADRDQKLPQTEGLQRRLAELEADRDRKFAWAENYKASMENEKQRADELADAIAELRMSKPVRFAAAVNRILRGLKLRR